MSDEPLFRLEESGDVLAGVTLDEVACRLAQVTLLQVRSIEHEATAFRMRS